MQWKNASSFLSCYPCCGCTHVNQQLNFTRPAFGQRRLSPGLDARCTTSSLGFDSGMAGSQLRASPLVGRRCPRTIYSASLMGSFHARSSRETHACFTSRALALVGAENHKPSSRQPYPRVLLCGCHQHFYSRTNELSCPTRPFRRPTITSQGVPRVQMGCSVMVVPPPCRPPAVPRP